MDRICEECGTRYSFTKKDIITKHVADKGTQLTNEDGLWKSYEDLDNVYVVCPACNRNNYLKRYATEPYIGVPGDSFTEGWTLMRKKPLFRV